MSTTFDNLVNRIREDDPSRTGKVSKQVLVDVVRELGHFSDAEAGELVGFKVELVDNKVQYEDFFGWILGENGPIKLEHLSEALKGAKFPAPMVPGQPIPNGYPTDIQQSAGAENLKNVPPVNITQVAGTESAVQTSECNTGTVELLSLELAQALQRARTAAEAELDSFRSKMHHLQYASEAAIKAAGAPFRSGKLNFAATTSKVVVLVSCGSFSPPTTFHLRLLEDARDQLIASGYHVAGGFLSPVHGAYGKKSLVPMHHRVNMVGLALQDSDWLDVDDWECAQEGYTLTAKVLKERFQKEITKLHPNAKIMMVCGGDLLESFTAFNKDGTPVWTSEDQQIILKQCGVVCMAREGTNLDKVISNDPLLLANKDNIVIFNAPVQNNVSSTLVRELLQQGKSLKYLLHEKVRQYIVDQDLKSFPQWQ